MRRHLFVGLIALMLVAVGAGVAAAGSQPRLATHGPTAVSGTEATALFRIGGRTVRQVLYADRETLTYSFALSNDGRLPVTITGLAPLEQPPTLFSYREISDAAGNPRFTIPAGERRTVYLTMRMTACERLSARAGSFATEANLRTQRAGMFDSVVHVDFPEEVHTGSPREAYCPRATATSRSPG